MNMKRFRKVLSAMLVFALMYCGHCAPCPQGIDVATVTKFLNLAKAQGAVPETVREHYLALSHTASECIGCGECEKRCPFGVLIRENLKQAAATFKKQGIV